MVKNVNLGEEISIETKNRVGLLADIAIILANHGVNIEAAAGYEDGKQARVMLITSANLAVANELRKLKIKSVKETEVVLVDLENKPGALKVVTTALANKKIDIRYHYVTTCSCGCASRMVMQTSNNEAAMAVLSKFIR